jgi:Heparinase II/III-like protein/Heparinase II/III N-terminus
MNLRWTLKRISAMGAHEVGYRSRQWLQARAERAGFGLVKPLSPNDKRGSPWVSSWPSDFSAKVYRDAADRILGGEFRLFGTREWKLGFPPAWNRDPASGVLAPLRFGKTLDYRDVSLVGNIKYLWEPNRHLELVTLAQAWHLTRDERYAGGCAALLDSWFHACPYMLGPNWTSSLEVALRMINWSCAWHLLGGENAPLFAQAGGQAIKQRWLSAVRQHCHFIAGHFSLYSSANNHLLGELLGLLIGSTTWPCWPESDGWRARSQQRFEEQAMLQNAADGVNKEQAIWYQHEVTDMLLLAGLTARANHCDFSPPFWQRLESMLEFISSCMDVGGNVPMFGDSDDAVIVRFDPSPAFRAYHSLLATGAVLFQRGDFKSKAQLFDDKSRWLLGDSAANAFTDLPLVDPTTRGRYAFTHGGYYILGSDLETPREVRLIADAAPLGYLSIAAHGHADALSLTLSIAGRPILIDPGTYCYHTERRWRDYFRGTSAHNTLRIDHQDQSVAGGAFLWSRHAQVRCLAFERGSERQELFAEHYGYGRLPDPVTHRREITYQVAEQLVEIVDQLICKDRHYVELFWHFSSECLVSLTNDMAVAMLDGIQVALTWPQPLQARVVRGQEDPCLGWLSRRFDQKEPTSTLVVAGSVGAHWRGVSQINISGLNVSSAPL